MTTRSSTVGSGAVTPAPLLRVTNLHKAFNGVPALRGVDIDVLPGEVHGLLGANGSGKSTMIKVLAGFHDADGGQVSIHGRELRSPFGPRGLRDQGMGFVHQDLGLAPAGTVLEHMALDAFGDAGAMRRVDWAAERRRVNDLIERFEVGVDVDATIDMLTPVQRAMVAVIRAVGGQERSSDADRRGQILVLDEPTVFLPRHEVGLLFDLLGRLRANGDAVLLVSHDLDEILQVTDRVTVFRNGETAGTRATAGSTRDDLVQLILGARDEHVAKGTAVVRDDRPPLLSARGLTGNRIDNLDLDLYAGEVVGITGLAGSGFEELPELLYGARRARAGEILQNGETVSKPKPISSMRRGVILIPADRKGQGGVLGLTVKENMSLPFLTDRAKGFRVDWKALAVQAQEACDRLNVVPPNPDAQFGHLSGGNQQKALLGKWMDTAPSVMLLSEPTQGVDIGARREIFKLIRAAVAEGMTVLCATSDYEQLVEMADRVIVLDQGHVRAELNGDDITKDALASAVYAEEAS
ncbi:ATP-binding cassette domain-containing protein [Aeromicrobium sp. SMF47]|uniref:sugar ABC transporter ATP-binding protein n=1 Tax=Aeromicrobium TaxID=2040 RepID=UPI00129E56ED|nr:MULTISPECIES: sugar ABC transporter ATP-binding protein [Aeromicrobium]MRJ75800.1 ATP-binding cassette domain-containing protein [Aeromicrobium yanjiei]MRK00143.1 ATP-binding cassette domain-containing protein [Aeromicrobium sp. S22]